MAENVGFFSNKLIISVPCCETPSTVDWAINLASQFWPLNISIEYSSQEGVDQDIDLLRCYTAGYALLTKTKYVWFLREFVLPPNWTVHRCLEVMRNDPKVMICAAVSQTNTPESIEYLDDVMVVKDENEKEIEILTVAAGSNVGLECTLVRGELFDLLKEPWFKSTAAVKSDAYLCKKTIEAGYKVCVHTGITCGYVDEAGRSIWPSEVLVA